MSLAILIALVQAALVAGPEALAKLKAAYPELATVIGIVEQALAAVGDVKAVPAQFWADVSGLAQTGQGPVGHDPSEAV